MNRWKGSVIKPLSTIRETIETIDKGAIQIAIVVDDQNHLLGTVTDGDVRRGILRGISLDAPVTEIMRKDPVTARETDDRQTYLELTSQRKIRQLPILDKKGRLVNVEILDDL